MTASRVLLVLAALFGAAGVSLMAAGSHVAPSLTVAGQMLLFHAPALIAIVLARDTGHLHPALAQIAAVVLAIGVAIFAADLAFRATASARLFPMAAPLGGSLTIFGWVILAAAAVLPPRPPP